MVVHLYSSQNTLGEGPLWHPEQELLYWVDITEGAFHTFDPKSNHVTQTRVGQAVGCLGFLENGSLIMALENGFGVWQNGQLELLHTSDSIHLDSGVRFNDGAVDRLGRFWAGTVGEGQCCNLYRLDPDGRFHRMLEGVSISNGIEWSLDDQTMYYVDSGVNTIYTFDFDLPSGIISTKRVLFHSSGAFGTPDGITIDVEGYLWCAFWDGWKIARISPSGEIVETYILPVQRPTSCIFGGTDLDTLYITSAREGIGEEALASQPQAGDVFHLKPGVRGVPPNKMSLETS